VRPQPLPPASSCPAAPSSHPNPHTYRTRSPPPIHLTCLRGVRAGSQGGPRERDCPTHGVDPLVSAPQRSLSRRRGGGQQQQGSGSSAPSSSALCSCLVPCRRSSLWDPLLLLLVNRSLRFLEIDPKAWARLEKTAASTEAKQHIGTVHQSPPFPSHSDRVSDYVRT
jgi:hypothetical protein